MSASSPVSVYVTALASVSVTFVPSVGEDGAALPAARRIITPAKSLSDGFVQDNVMDEFVIAAALTSVTLPGAVSSS